ncbi:MAG: crossover junction endodeoxyribonuclease RuvC [Planctomycetota bacterium]|nr:MAG: crossover junction endodeoxyribonuclease RuvC [Planctomycetota bacterium]
MIVLGIDPGLRLTGYAAVRADPGRPADAPALVEAGVIRLDASAPVAARLVELERDLAGIVARLAPTCAFVEKLFAHYKHPTTAIAMGHARGVCLLAVHRAGVEVAELAATEVKKATTGGGHASKRQMQLAVQALLGLPEPPSPPDVADAIAIALTGARRRTSTAPSPGAPSLASARSI